MGHHFYLKKGFSKSSLNVIVRELDLKGKVIRDISIGDVSGNYNEVRFVSSYFDKRKFLVVSYKYFFYIIDLVNCKAEGVFEPKFERLGGDAISGYLTCFEIFDDGKYLLGFSADKGIFCYNLTNLNKPIQVNGKYNGFSVFFLDSNKVDSINGIFANYLINYNSSKKCVSANGYVWSEIRYIFKDLKLQIKNKNSESIIENRYLVFNKLDYENDLIIDCELGIILDKIADKNLIIKILKEYKKF